ncbi:zinc finger protein 512B isoform X2 [Boleophthalmus pectinirostris]|nr:zinc finger protein 512B isoform X2 [Boleophthalmus pectinirostris]XP_055022340.1 zinc finger protein 512B isoform X2 [Boleophthalmus pectinirostris]
MEIPGGPRFGKLSSPGLPRARPFKPGPQQDTVKATPAPETNNKHSPTFDDLAEGKKKSGRPKTEVQELRSIPAHLIVQWKEEFKRRSRVRCPCSGCWLEFPSIYGVKYHYQRCQGPTVAEKLSHGCPYCEAVFATKIRLEKHKLWNHPERTTMEPKDDEPKIHKTHVKSSVKKRPMENSPPSPVFFKVKKTHEASMPSQNGELSHKADKKPHIQNQTSPNLHQSAPSLPTQAQSQSQSTSSDAGGSESEGGLPPSYPDEDPERMKHRRKQKTPKKFTGEQPSISGTFGLKGMTKVEEKLKAGRVKRPEGGTVTEEPQKRPTPVLSKKDPATTSSGVVPDTQWQRSISERGEVVCPTCSIVTRKTVQGLKKHMEICQKLQDALKCQQCHKQFRSKAGLNYHNMAEHTTKSSGNDDQTMDEHEERERLRRVLKQMGRIKCPSEGCSAHFSSLMGYQYHQKRCGRDSSEDDKPMFICHHCGKSYRSKAGKDYHIRTEHSSLATNNTDTNNNTGKERESDKPSSGHKKEHCSLPEKRDWPDNAVIQTKEKQKEPTVKDRDKEKGRVSVQPSPNNSSSADDFERTPSGRVRRRSAQVAVFHLQEIAEDELAKDWGTKRRIKDDLVPDTKRLNYTRPGLPHFSPELLESWKNQVKEKGFICCINENCEAVYSSVSGLKAHLANCSQGGGELGKYTCLICQKEFSSESGVKYHINKTHSQNWFRASDTQAVSSSSSSSSSSSKSKPPVENHLPKSEVRNGATAGKKRGRKPKERPLVASSPLTNTEASTTTQSSSSDESPSSTAPPSPAEVSEPTNISLTSGQDKPPDNSANRRIKPVKLSLSE